MDRVLPYLKAIAAFITPGVGILIYAASAASDGGTSITTAEWLLTLGACLGTGGVVYGVPNKDPKGKRQDESVQPPKRRLRKRKTEEMPVTQGHSPHRDERGESALTVALVLLVVVVILVILFGGVR